MMANSAGPAIIPANVAVTRGKSGSQTQVKPARSTTPSQRSRPNSGCNQYNAGGDVQVHTRYATNPNSEAAISSGSQGPTRLARSARIRARPKRSLLAATAVRGTIANSIPGSVTLAYV